MKTRILALGVLALLSGAQVAHAAVYYDTIDAPPVTSGAPGAGGTDGAGSGAANVAASFSLPGLPGTLDLSVTLALSALNDSQSYMIYLVPDNGSVPGGAGAPNFLAGATLLTSGLDSSLSTNPAAPSMVSFGIDQSLLTAASGEYWIDLATNVKNLTTAGTANWTMNGDGSGGGTANQLIYDGGGFLAGTSGISSATGAFEMVVADPEPASLGVIGVGLAALGYVRRRRAAKQA